MPFKPIRNSPCKNCPFRTDVEPYLTKGRIRSLARSLLRMGETFTCHKTLDYNTKTGAPKQTQGTQACAGAAILLQKANRPNTAMQIAERLGLWEPSELDLQAPVFDTFEEMERAQDR